MKKRYKLIQEFPGSPNLGHIVEEYEESELQNYYHSINEDEDCNSLKMYYSNNLTCYPNFWKLVIEKHYKIISYIGSSTNSINKNKIWNVSNIENPGNHLVNKPAWNINSIKRLSDGEIFTIGDKCNHSKFGGNGIIKNIRIIYNTDILVFKLDWCQEWKNSDDSECFLENLIKINI